jgi:hypothetical protein
MKDVGVMKDESLRRLRVAFLWVLLKRIHMNLIHNILCTPLSLSLSQACLFV